MDDLSIPSISLSPAWVDFFILLGAIVTMSLLAFIWFFFFAKGGKKKRHRRHRHRHHRSTNPTLAETGGLPPVRAEDEPPTQS